MLYFDSKGYLTPYKAIRSNIEELKNYLVDSIKSETRRGNFNKYIRYSNDLKRLLGGNSFTQWINGSFVTKKANPQDIDIVVFLSDAQIKKLGRRIDSFNAEGSLSAYGVDAYIVEIHSPGSKFHSHTLGNTAYWIDLFGSTKVNRAGIKYRKGFIEIIY